MRGDGGWVLEEYFNNVAHTNQKLGAMTVLYRNSYVPLALRHLASPFHDKSAAIAPLPSHSLGEVESTLINISRDMVELQRKCRPFL